MIADSVLEPGKHPPSLIEAEGASMKRLFCLCACALLLLAGAIQLALGFAHKANRTTRTPNASRARATTSDCGPNNSNTPGCNVNRPFVPGCDPLPYPKRMGLAIDRICPNEGCGSRASDKAQNRDRHSCADGVHNGGQVATGCRYTEAPGPVSLQ